MDKTDSGPKSKRKSGCIRTRKGCGNCRVRRRKCDETKPVCQRCSRRGVQCDGYAVQYSFLDQTLAVRTLAEIRQAKKLAAKQKRNSQSNYVPEKSAYTEGTPTAGDLALFSNHVSGLPSMLDLSFFHKHDVDPNGKQLDVVEQREKVGCPVRNTGSSISIAPCREIDFVQKERQEFSYLDYYKKFVAFELPAGYLPSIWSSIDHPSIRTAVAALSAYDLAILQSMCSDGPGSPVKPDYSVAKRHLQPGMEYHGKVLQYVSQMLSEMDDLSLVRVLLMIMLCAKFDTITGNMEGIKAHMKASRTFVLTHHRKISKSASGKALLSAWALLQTLHDTTKLSFHPLDLDVPQGAVYELIHNYSDRTGTVLSLYNQAQHIHARAAVAKSICQSRGNTYNTMDDSLAWYHDNFGKLPVLEDMLQLPREFLSRSSWLQHRSIIAASLDAWLGGIDERDLPLQSVEIASECTSSNNYDKYDNLRPLKFNSCTAAMNYLYYAAGRIFTGQGAYRHLDWEDIGPESPKCTNDNDIETWTIIILRILLNPDLTTNNGQFKYQLGPLMILWRVCQSYGNERVISFIMGHLLPSIEKATSSGWLKFNLNRFYIAFKFLADLFCKDICPIIIHAIHPSGCTEMELWQPQTESWYVVHGRYGMSSVDKFIFRVANN